MNTTERRQLTEVLEVVNRNAKMNWEVVTVNEMPGTAGFSHSFVLNYLHFN